MALVTSLIAPIAIIGISVFAIRETAITIGVYFATGVSILTFLALIAKTALGQRVLSAFDTWFLAPVTRAAQNRRRADFAEAVAVIIAPLATQVEELQSDVDARFDRLDDRVDDIESRLTALEEETP